MLACYRLPDAGDPEVFVAAVAAVFSHYPPEIAQRVADPVSGLPAKSKWIPSVAEVREACDRLHGENLRMAQSDARRHRQLAEREEWETKSRIPKAKWDALRQEFITPEQKMSPADWQAHAERLRYDANPVQLSPELVKRLGYLKP